MTTLERLYTERGESPWLDNLTRGCLRDGTLARTVADGIRGVTANPTVFTKAIVGSADYDDHTGLSLEDQGIAGFHPPCQQVLAALADKTHPLSRR